MHGEEKYIISLEQRPDRASLSNEFWARKIIDEHTGRIEYVFSRNGLIYLKRFIEDLLEKTDENQMAND